jgi:LysR family glycine cleavage system transcriptional activator
MSRRALPSLTGLRAFEAYGRLRSMTRAADDLRVTHGAVSRQIKALEADVGAALLAGPRHRLELTAAGARLASALSGAFDLIGGALPGAGPGRVLNVSCLSALAMKWLIPRLPGFVTTHPGVQVQILEGWRPADFGDGVIHAAIRADRPPAARGQRVTAFMPNFHGPVLSPARFRKIGEDRSRALELCRLRSETFLASWAAWASGAGVALPAAGEHLTFEHSAYMLEAAAAGLGIAVTTWAFAAPDILSGRLVAPWGFNRLAQPFVYIRPRADNPAAEAFGAWLVSEGRRSPTPPPHRPE